MAEKAVPQTPIQSKCRGINCQVREGAIEGLAYKVPKQSMG